MLHTNRGQDEHGNRQTRETSAPAPALSAKAGGQWAFDALRLSVSDALRLQSFRADYPVQGGKTKQFEQVGNAVPPMLAAAVLEQFFR